MNTDRTVVLENTGDCPIGLADTQKRLYRLPKGSKMRISAVTLMDILDYPGSRVLFNEGYAKVSNITRAELYAMGLNEDEIDKYLIAEPTPAVVITEDMNKVEEVIPVAPIGEKAKEALKEEIIKEIEEKIIDKEPEEVEEHQSEKKAPAKKTTKKAPSKAKKTTSKSTK